MKKTIQEWSELLPEEVREKFIKEAYDTNFKEHGIGLKPHTIIDVFDIRSALKSAILWDKTQDGHDFWKNIHANLWQNFGDLS